MLPLFLKGRSIGKSTALMVALFILAFPAEAQFNGPYVGVHAGGAIVDTRLAVSGFEDGGQVTTGLAGAQIGWNRQLTPWSVFGVEASFDLYRMTDGTAPAIGTSGATLDKGASVLARMGYVFAPHAMAYVGVGYGWTWVKDLSAGPGLSIGMPRGDAPLAVLGIEWKFSKHMSLDGRYRVDFSPADQIMVLGTPIDVDRTAHSLRLGLNWSFYEDPPAHPARKPGAP